MSRKTKIEGMTELQSLFSQLEKVPQRVASKAARAGATIIRKAARQNAPVDEGNLKKALVLKRERSKVKGRSVYQVTIDRNMNDHFVSLSNPDSNGKVKRGYYPASQEYGFMTRDGGYVPGYRYMRKSADENNETATRKILEVTGTEVDKVLNQKR